VLICMTLLPIYDNNLKVIIIGTEPGQLSIETGHYYSDPRNSFYRDLHLTGFLPRLIHPSECLSLPNYNIGLDDVYNDPEALEIRLESFKPLSVCFNSKEALCRFLKISNTQRLKNWAGESAGKWVSFSWKPIVWALYDSSGIAIRYHKERIVQLRRLYKKLFK